MKSNDIRGLLNLVAKGWIVMVYIMIKKLKNGRKTHNTTKKLIS